MNPYFDVISISGDLKMQKPDPHIFQLTMEQLGCEAAECIYVDDRRKNLAAAKSLGMCTVMFNSRNMEYEGDTVMSFQGLHDMLMQQY